MTDGFLSRWSKRKIDVREGKAVVEPEAPVKVDLAPDSPVVLNDGQVNAPLAVAPPPELPTLADTQSLTPESDFKPFMARGVASDVKNAAMKKLFTDPHFNVMDGLDTYIDDYSLPDPIPEAMLRKLVSAKFLNLFAEEEEPATPRDDPDTAATEVVAQSPPEQTNTALEAPTEHDDIDLRLQPDHATAGQEPGRGTA
jgi:Protein of unknown function (DUF3306)